MFQLLNIERLLLRRLISAVCLVFQKHVHLSDHDPGRSRCPICRSRLLWRWIRYWAILSSNILVTSEAIVSLWCLLSFLPRDVLRLFLSPTYPSNTSVSHCSIHKCRHIPASTVAILLMFSHRPCQVLRLLSTLITFSYIKEPLLQLTIVVT